MFIGLGSYDYILVYKACSSYINPDIFFIVPILVDNILSYYSLFNGVSSSDSVMFLVDRLFLGCQYLPLYRYLKGLFRMFLDYGPYCFLIVKVVKLNDDYVYFDSKLNVRSNYEFLPSGIGGKNNYSLVLLSALRNQGNIDRGLSRFSTSVGDADHKRNSKRSNDWYVFNNASLSEDVLSVRHPELVGCDEFTYLKVVSSASSHALIQRLYFESDGFKTFIVKRFILDELRADSYFGELFKEYIFPTSSLLSFDGLSSFLASCDSYVDHLQDIGVYVDLDVVPHVLVFLRSSLGQLWNSCLVGS
jgi:hypothetical protein